jgi:hypothetical protein
MTVRGQIGKSQIEDNNSALPSKAGVAQVRPTIAISAPPHFYGATFDKTLSYCGNHSPDVQGLRPSSQGGRGHEVGRRCDLRN